MFKKWTTYLVKRYLISNERRSGKHELVPFKQVSKVGVVYRAGQEPDEKYRKYIEEKLEGLGKKVMTLGFIDKKEVGVNLQPNIHHDYFARKDLSMLRLPKKTRVMRFVSEPFDYLIYCSEEVSVPLLGITALSRAKCRVGPFLDEMAFGFDLLIKKSDDGHDYAEQIVKYLMKFNNE